MNPSPFPFFPKGPKIPALDRINGSTNLDWELQCKKWPLRAIFHVATTDVTALKSRCNFILQMSNDERQFPHLHINEGTMRQLRDEQTAPRYQTTNMTVETN